MNTDKKSRGEPAHDSDSPCTGSWKEEQIASRPILHLCSSVGNSVPFRGSSRPDGRINLTSHYVRVLGAAMNGTLMGRDPRPATPGANVRAGDSPRRPR